MQLQLFDFGTDQALTPTKTESLTQYVARFMTHGRIAKSLSNHTLRAYQGDLGLFVLDLGTDVRPSEITRERVWQHIRWLREERRLCEASVKRRLATLRVFFRWLEAEGAVPLSLFHRLGLAIRLPKRLPRALDGGDLRLLLDAVEREDCGGGLDQYDAILLRAAVLVLLSTGLRISELVSIRLENVSVSDSSILVHGKGNRERRVYLSGGLANEALKRLLRGRRSKPGNAHLFVDEQGQRISAQFVRSRLRSVAVRAGLSRRVTPHMLRHTAASRLVEAGVDTRFVQRLLGHSSIATTQIYTQVTDRMLKMRLNDADALGLAWRSEKMESTG